MSKKAISFTKLNDTLQISEHNDGFWLYDFTQSMNLAMRAKTRDAAFVEALTYYQKHLSRAEKAYKDLKSQVDSFGAPFIEEHIKENDE
jgi:hypothetical protein